MTAEITKIEEFKENKMTQDSQVSYLDKIFKEQKESYQRHQNPDIQERIHHLKLLRKGLLRYQDKIINAINEDFGCRAKDESILAEILPSIEGIRYAIKHVKKWMKPSRRNVGMMFLPAWAKVIYQPLGVVGIIAPWNYPVYLALGPLTGSLAAGNRAMIKMSEFTPQTAEVVRSMLGDIFEEDHVAVVTGDAKVGEAFSKKPWDHLLFTGSTTVGRHVMSAAAKNLTPVTLELGGKSPVIISESYSMKDAAERIAFGKVFNLGQTCVAPDYLLCPKERLNGFLEAFRNIVLSMFPTMKDNSDFTSVVNDRQYQRLQGLISDAAEKGARIETISPSDENFSDTRKMPIHLVLNATEEMRVLQEEIFGPILPIVLYDTLKDAVDYVNTHPRPLALYYFDHDKEKINYVLSNTHSGGVVINDTLIHVAQDDLPFGGVGPSGMGSYHSHEGFLTFSKEKGVVFKPGFFNSTKLIYPPYGQLIHNLIYKIFLR